MLEFERITTEKGKPTTFLPGPDTRFDGSKDCRELQLSRIQRGRNRRVMTNKGRPDPKAGRRVERYGVPLVRPKNEFAHASTLRFP